ncbi:AAA family ATPase [Streptomyces sp. NPDC001530]|uniref:helix-turn-helix transcriptional regulator n=1 Tax=Streptomyces sp. NPDC001530 TaxID=3364582 RepID=UPI0036C49E04
MTSSDPGSEALFGRLQELEFLRRFTSEVRVTGGALLLSGDPGVGKTTLLDAAVDSARASGMTVLRVVGAEFEAEVGFAGLSQALFPLLDDFEQLSAVHADALRVALGFGAGPPPDRLLVSNAVALLLRRVAARAPLLLIVDDLPWVDRASAGVLSFVSRRLIGSRAGLLAASRTGQTGYFDRSGLPEYQVQALDDEAAHRLLTARFPDLDPQVRARVLSTAQGNPLALLELPQTLSGPQRAATEPLPQVLPLGQRLQRLFASRVASLPPPTRTLLLTVALEGTGELGVLHAAASAGYRLDDLAAAERNQLVRVEEDARRVTFRHPLIRSAVVEMSTSSERRQVHRALAEAFVDLPERGAWHLGEASVAPDEQVAALLEEAAHHVLPRGDYQTVVSMLSRAADLSPDPAERGRRLAEAAYIGAEGMGEVKSVAELLDETRQAGRQASASLHYASAAAFVMLDGDGHVDTAHHLLAGAIEGSARRDDAGDPALVNALMTLLLICFFGGRADLWEPFHRALARLSPKPPPLLALPTDLCADPARTGAAALPRLTAALATVHEADPESAQTLAACTMYADRLAEVREPLWRMVLEGREGGPARRHLVALMDLCVDDFHRGEWEEAAELAAEGLALCEERAGRFFRWYFDYHQALLAAVQGRFETSRALAEQLIGWAGPRGLGLTQVYARHALVLAGLGQGDFEAAYLHATAISPAGTLASHVPHALWVAIDLVEAAVRTGRLAEAELHVRAMREANVSALSPRLAVLEAGSAALVADDDRAPALFEAALSLPTVDQWPFDTARIRLAYGERLRRARAATEARVHLQTALAAFQKLGAGPWVTRAERELRAAGQATRTPAHARGVDALTPQELQIARLAASGMTNKEIAERLYLSPRTVGGHLYRIFPKLGITKRAALRDSIGTDGP